eukprot:CAMPEP_0185539874 /NCGR_PEP_ID=MMETSP1381-20130426/548_1 /TAXON_ID=298111 /ORGANISM="Pavlova sp., Strain CCMP459" /LENGTH=390 /DNA_ID=CAMNT_0028151617 /DNA_START=1057 /DNA_END=2229 /DNA_ORIENTATION=-
MLIRPGCQVALTASIPLQIWEELLRKHLTSLRSKPTSADPCLYVKHFPDGTWILMPIYVDDGLVSFMCDVAVYEKFAADLTALLDGRIKWGPADEFLQMDILQSSDRSTVSVSMESYIRSALATLDSDGKLKTYSTAAEGDILKRMSTDTSRVLTPSEKSEYLHAVGMLGYIRKLRCDIEYATSLVASRVQAPTAYDAQCVNRIFGYLKGSASIGRTFNGDPVLRGFSDADFGNAPDGRSYSGHVVMLGGSAIVARTRKQSVATTATADSELLALGALVRSMDETLVTLGNLGVNVQTPVELYCDNSATVLAATTLSARKSRHLANQAAYVREHTLSSRSMRVNLIGTKHNLADFFTKALGRDDFLRFRSQLMEGRPVSPHAFAPRMTRK